MVERLLNDIERRNLELRLKCTSVIGSATCWSLCVYLVGHLVVFSKSSGCIASQVLLGSWAVSLRCDLYVFNCFQHSWSLYACLSGVVLWQCTQITGLQA